MEKILDITSTYTALNVDREMNTAYFQAILRALQETVTAHGFQFVRVGNPLIPGGDQGEKVIDADALAPEILSSMATSVNKARHVWLGPQTSDERLEIRLEMDQEGGDDHAWLMGLIRALSSQGIVLNAHPAHRDQVPACRADHEQNVHPSD